MMPLLVILAILAVGAVIYTCLSPVVTCSRCGKEAVVESGDCQLCRACWDELTTRAAKD